MLRSNKTRKGEGINGTRYLLMLALALMVGTPFLPPKAVANTSVIYASYKYVMGDNDTKNDAKRLCFIGAKRRLLEKAGTFIISMSEAQDFRLTKDEIITYSAGFLDAEVAEEKVVTTGETLEIVMTLKANIDIDDVKRTLTKISNDVALKHKIAEQSNKLLELENKLKTYKDQLAAVNYEGSFQLRKERKEAFDAHHVEEEAIRQIILSKRKRDDQRTKIIAVKSQQVRKVLSCVELGMTPQEVREIVRIITGDTLVRKEKPKPSSHDQFVLTLIPQDQATSKSEPAPDTYIWDRFSFYFCYDEHITSFSLRLIGYPAHSPLGYEVIVKSKKRNILEMTHLRAHPSHKPKPSKLEPFAARIYVESAARYVWGKED